MILLNNKRIDGVSLDTVPVGTISPFIGLVAPQGYLLCQGQKVSKNRYKQLYNICKSLFGPETETEFYLPDLRGRVIAGLNENDATINTIGKILGTHEHNHSTGNHTLTVDEMPEHTHSVEDNCDTGATQAARRALYSYNAGTKTGWGQPFIKSAGGSQPHNHGDTGLASNYQPTTVMNYIVKAEMVIPNQSTVYDGLDSDSEVDSLSARQGKILNNKFNNYLPLHATADKAATVGNLTVRPTAMAWGTLTEANGYTLVNAWDTPTDGGMALADKDKQLSVQIDGVFYQREGKNRVLDTSDLGNYGFYKFPAGTTVSSSSSPSKEISIVTKGRPIFLCVTGDINPSGTEAATWMHVYLYRDGALLTSQIVESHAQSWNNPFAVNYLDVVGAGTHVYKVVFSIGNGSMSLAEEGGSQSPNFTVFEI